MIACILAESHSNMALCRHKKEIRCVVTKKSQDSGGRKRRADGMLSREGTTMASSNIRISSTLLSLPNLSTPYLLLTVVCSHLHIKTQPIMAQKRTNRRQHQREGRLLGIPPPPQAVADPNKPKKKKKNLRRRAAARKQREAREAEDESDDEMLSDWSASEPETEESRERRVEMGRQRDRAAEEEAEAIRRRESEEEIERAEEQARQMVEDQTGLEQTGLGDDGMEEPFKIDDNILRPTQPLPFNVLPQFDEQCTISRYSGALQQGERDRQAGLSQQVGNQLIRLTSGLDNMAADQWHTVQDGTSGDSSTFRLSTVELHNNTHPSYGSNGFKPIYDPMLYSVAWKTWCNDFRDPNSKRIQLLIRGIDGFVTSLDVLQKLQDYVSELGISITIVFYLGNMYPTPFFTYPIQLQDLLSSDTEQLRYLRTRLGVLATARTDLISAVRNSRQSEGMSDYSTQLTGDRNTIAWLERTSAQLSPSAPGYIPPPPPTPPPFQLGQGCPEPMCATRAAKFARKDEIKIHYKKFHTTPKLTYDCRDCVVTYKLANKAREHEGLGHTVDTVEDSTNIAPCPVA